MNDDVKMTVLGANNDIQIKCDEVTKSKIVLYIEGNNNKVMIEEGVRVAQDKLIKLQKYVILLKRCEKFQLL